MNKKAENFAELSCKVLRFFSFTETDKTFLILILYFGIKGAIIAMLLREYKKSIKKDN